MEGEYKNNNKNKQTHRSTIEVFYVRLLPSTTAIRTPAYTASLALLSFPPQYAK